MTYFCGENYENGKIDLPLFEELGQTSRDLWDTWSETLKSRDVCPNSSKTGFYDFFHVVDVEQMENFKVPETCRISVRLTRDLVVRSPRVWRKFWDLNVHKILETCNPKLKNDLKNVYFLGEYLNYKKV